MRREYESGSFLCQSVCGKAEMDKPTDPAYLPANLPPASSVWSKTETLSGNSWLMSKGNSIVYPNKLHRLNNQHNELLFFYESVILFFFFGSISWCKLRCAPSPPTGQEGSRHDNFNFYPGARLLSWHSTNKHTSECLDQVLFISIPHQKHPRWAKCCTGTNARLTNASQLQSKEKFEPFQDM